MKKTRIISICSACAAAICLAAVAFAGCSAEEEKYPLADGELLHEPVLAHTYDEEAGTLSFTCVCETCGADFMPVMEIGVYKGDEFTRLYSFEEGGSSFTVSDYESGATYTFVPYNAYTDRFMTKFEIQMP